MRRRTARCYSITVASLVRRCGFEAPGPILRGRTKPQLGQDEVPGLEADQCAGIPSGPEAFPQNGPLEALRAGYCSA